MWKFSVLFGKHWFTAQIRSLKLSQAFCPYLRTPMCLGEKCDIEIPFKDGHWKIYSLCIAQLWVSVLITVFCKMKLADPIEEPITILLLNGQRIILPHKYLPLLIIYQCTSQPEDYKLNNGCKIHANTQGATVICMYTIPLNTHFMSA